MIPKDLPVERKVVSLFGITFPRLTQGEAVEYVSSQIAKKKGIAVCFPDMSTLNLVHKDPLLGALIEKEFLPLNDGIGLKIASFLEAKSFLENLNGTDFVPALFKTLKKGTSIFLLGSKKGVAQEARCLFQRLFSDLRFVGSAYGYFNAEEEKELIHELNRLKPDLVLVGMGNPLQLQWIHKQRQCVEFSHTSWLAVGGLLDFYGGGRKRAPEWMKNLRLEWLHIMWCEPHKFRRYGFGIPVFLWNTFLKTIRRRHKTISKI